MNINLISQVTLTVRRMVVLALCVGLPVTAALAAPNAPSTPAENAESARITKADAARAAESATGGEARSITHDEEIHAFVVVIGKSDQQMTVYVDDSSGKVLAIPQGKD